MTSFIISVSMRDKISSSRVVNIRLVRKDGMNRCKWIISLVSTLVIVLLFGET